MTKIAGIIPARYASTRFEGKPLALILGKPMVLYVAELSAKALGKENVYVATEHSKIAEVVTAAGFQVLMTSTKALTGTDRLWEAATQIDAEIIINIQGDEPILDPVDIALIARKKQAYPDHVLCGMSPVLPDEDPHNVNIPKVVCNESGQLLYMSRLAVPGFKDPKNKPDEWVKQVCIYGFSKDQLAQFAQFGRKSVLEHSEDIEILRFFELNIPIQMITVSGSSRAVDVPGDIALVESDLQKLQLAKGESLR